jgi:phage FluMu protein Com
MQIRCYHCHKPFALSKDAVHAALDTMMVSEQHHYNAFCPHCRRANRVSYDELARAAPDWSANKRQEESPAEESQS